ncbi:MAG TPA: YkgJ family cysteine cluster protein [Bryobacteraceae bacterium]|nr:YkgJ family cysteine cluster protein [Bryobacteraceae bacterium]
MTADRALIQIVDATMAEAVRLSGSWLACRPGCFECCIGPFPITGADAVRLREGLAALALTEPDRAARVQERARQSVTRICREFPDDPVATVLAVDEAAADEPCPALDPATGTCDLYAFRPVTCRTFGPAVSCGGEALVVCELCYRGATDEEIAACRVEFDYDDLDQAGETVVAWVLADPSIHREEVPNAP